MLVIPNCLVEIGLSDGDREAREIDRASSISPKLLGVGTIPLLGSSYPDKYMP